MRRANFDVTLHGDVIDGQSRARLTIEVDDHGRGSAIVTPFRRKPYRVSLETAALCIAWRAAKETVAAQGGTIPVPRRRGGAR